ncbi:hypothetical protein E0500_031780 [Streptomyces sp. KM273126]|uniref:DUF7919 family protein n=1 Tax=Streptomyces sp. KM273126 TaxID=2545247 RepID=UPI00103D55C3|nr:hypothetical protein [Streptomyces sp. KM273126]MBA2811778.1 hypothetical protein [Streptomyces sp. KM273126]
MFYEDLSTYSYSDDGDIFTDCTTGMRFVSFQPAYERLNVGWLEAARPWTQGTAPDGFTDKLLEILAAQEVNSMLGLHYCGLCPTLLDGSHQPGSSRASAGTGEIRVPGPPGIAFAAPQLIGHYVADHGYLPPQGFIDTVFAFDLRGTSSTSYPWIRFPWIPDGADLYDARFE